VEVKRLKEEFRFSERHACELMSIPRSSCRYQSRKDDSGLRQQLIELAKQKPRFGYRRLYILLRRAGQLINHKRVQRVYRAAGLCAANPAQTAGPGLCINAEAERTESGVGH
jgi:putative transposase